MLSLICLFILTMEHWSKRLVYLLHNMKNSKLKNNIEEYIEEVWVRKN